MSRGNFVAGTSCVKKEATHERLDMPEMFLRVALGLNLHEQVQAMPRYHAEAALLLHPKNSKAVALRDSQPTCKDAPSQALYRRGLAGLGCGLLQQVPQGVVGVHCSWIAEKAKEDLREAAKLEPRPRWGGARCDAVILLSGNSNRRGRERASLC